jgi:glutathione S-transferase
MLRILGRANAINVRKVLWLADEIGIPYVREDWGRGHRSTSLPDFAKLSPFGRVPVIEDDGLIVRESHTILRYLARKHGQDSLYPQDRRAITDVEAWMDWSATDLYAGARLVFLAIGMKTPGYHDARMLETGVFDWTREMRILDRHLATNGPCLHADQFTIADIPVGLLVNRWFSLDFVKPDFPAVAGYYELLSTRPAFRKHGRNGVP